MVDYFSFEDVMKELELSEEDLKRMVSEGELRAFRDENKMKFKKEDVDNLKKGRITEPTIILPSTPGGAQDETVLDLDIGQETASLGAEAPPARTPTRIPGRRPPAPPPIPEPSESEETFIEEESETGLSTEPLKLADEVEAAETVESETVTEEIAQAPRRGRPTGRVTAATRARTVPMSTEDEIEKRRPHPVWAALIIFAFILSAYSAFFVYDLLMIENGRQLRPSGLTAGFATWSLNNFWGDSGWKKFHEREYPADAGIPPYTISTDQKPAPKPEKPWYSGPSFMDPDRPPSPYQQQSQ